MVFFKIYTCARVMAGSKMATGSSTDISIWVWLTHVFLPQWKTYLWLTDWQLHLSLFLLCTAISSMDWLHICFSCSRTNFDKIWLVEESGCSNHTKSVQPDIVDNCYNQNRICITLSPHWFLISYKVFLLSNDAVICKASFQDRAMWLACLLSLLLGLLVLCQVAVVIIFYSSRNVQVGQFPVQQYLDNLFRLRPEKKMSCMRMIGFLNKCLKTKLSIFDFSVANLI